MPTDAELEKPTPAPIGAAAAPLAGVAVDKAVEVAKKIIDMIADKEIRDSAKTTFAEITADIYKAAYEAERNYRERRRKLNRTQRQDLTNRLKDCERLIEEANSELKDAVDAANAGKKDVAEDHFDRAKKKARAAVEAYKKFVTDKEKMIADNAPDQPDDGGVF